MNLRPFELVLVIVFIALLALSLVFMSIYKGGSSNDGMPVLGTVSIWGTLPGEQMAQVLLELSQKNEAYRGVSYRYIETKEFDNQLVNALADGVGPDVVLVSHERLVDLRKRIQPISYDSFPLRDVRSLYIDGAQIFALSDGLYGYPIAVDPLMMYWNRDILATDSFLEAPKTWESLVNVYFPTLIRRNDDRTITRGVVALGEYNNVRNSFGIISMLLLQSGSQGVIDEGSQQYSIRIDQANTGQFGPLSGAADFYTRFSKTNNSLYSWNRSFSEDRASFIGGDLALYFGYGSEGYEIERLNPNLNFDIAEVPQGDAATVRRTYGQFYALSALRTSDNLSGAATVMRDLSSQENALKIAQAYNLVPALRSLVGAGSNDTYGQISYKSAGVAYGWLSPNRAATDVVFSTLLQDLIENRSGLTEATSDAIGRLQLEYN